MSKKKNLPDNGIVYSTDPSFTSGDGESADLASLPPAEQKLKVLLDKKQRAGKAVTLVDGYVGNTADLETLGKKIKTFCGTGGSVKDGYIIVQGDQRDKVMQWLLANGFKHTK